MKALLALQFDILLALVAAAMLLITSALPVLSPAGQEG